MSSSRKRPWILMVFPSTSQAIMAGSIGELTSLVRLAQGLPSSTFRISYAEVLRDEDADCRVDGLLKSLHGFALLEVVPGSDGRPAVRQRPLRGSPDAIILSSFRAFFQYPIIPEVSDALLAACRAAGTRVLALDPCGDSFIAPFPDDVLVLVPRPFTYAGAARSGQVLFSTGSPPLPRQLERHGRWLWAAAPWMQAFRRFQAAERLAFFGLAHAGVEVSVISPLDPTMPFLGRCHAIDASLGYGALEEEVARHDLLLTANCRSALAARAAAMGVPLALIDPVTIPDSGWSDTVTEEALRAGAAEQPFPVPVPEEFSTVWCENPEVTVASMAALRHARGSLHERQRVRRTEYARLPSANDALTQILASQG